jgi:hypothetical protein
MTERMAFYFRGPSPSPEISDAFVEDLKTVLDLPVDVLRQIGDELACYNGFLSNEIQEEIISRYIDNADRSVASRLGKVIRFGEFVLQYDKGGVETLLSQLEQWQRRAENRDPELLTSDQFSQIRERIPLIIKEYPARLRQSKAHRLAEATGLRAESIDLVCDFRPVLDESRSQIIGVIPFTTLKVVASGVDRFPITFEAILSAKDVQELLKDAELAVKKLNVMGEFAARHDIKIPAVDLTETVENKRVIDG